MKSVEYFEKMARDGRMIVIRINGDFHAFLAFSICDDTRFFEEKDLWEYLPHNPDGRICFVEKMACTKWTKALRQKIEEEIVNRYPQIEGAVWFRPGLNNERKVVYRRRCETRL